MIGLSFWLSVIPQVYMMSWSSPRVSLNAISVLPQRPPLPKHVSPKPKHIHVQTQLPKNLSCNVITLDELIGELPVLEPLKPEIANLTRGGRHFKPAHLKAGNGINLGLKPYLKTLNGQFLKMGKDFPFCGFPELWFDDNTKQRTLGFEIFFDYDLINEDEPIVLPVIEKKTDWVKQFGSRDIATLWVDEVCTILLTTVKKIPLGQVTHIQEPLQNWSTQTRKMFIQRMKKSTQRKLKKRYKNGPEVGLLGHAAKFKYYVLYSRVRPTNDDKIIPTRWGPNFNKGDQLGSDNVTTFGTKVVCMIAAKKNVVGRINKMQLVMG